VGVTSTVKFTAGSGKTRPMSRAHLACFVLFLYLPILAGAQEVSTPAGAVVQSPPVPGPAVEEGRIKLDVVVTDKSGKPVSGLDSKDFSLFDNKQPAKILSFQTNEEAVQKAGQTAQVILFIDTVNLGIQAVEYTQQQIENFLRQNGGHLSHPVSIFLFTDEGVNIEAQPSTDGTALAAQLDKAGSRLRSIGRSAGANGAIERFQLSVQTLTEIVKSLASSPGRKVLIWAGPGWPLLIGPNIQIDAKGQQRLFQSIVELSTTMREARISLYSISFGEPDAGNFLYQGYLKGVRLADKANLPNLTLKVLAIQSGGRVLGPSNDLVGQINSCVEDAGVFYTLSFDPPRADRANEYHDLKVQVDKAGLTARTDTGYYNQP
jgi:VWFA-related protein